MLWKYSHDTDIHLQYTKTRILTQVEFDRGKIETIRALKSPSCANCMFALTWHLRHLSLWKLLLRNSALKSKNVRYRDTKVVIKVSLLLLLKRLDRLEERILQINQLKNASKYLQHRVDHTQSPSLTPAIEGKSNLREASRTGFLD